ncbi:4Fe-4S dicluster domain-containing protein [Roseomonas sp. NAR14]|uniref:4Fe-4S dicluster domain-containing protein n=1 Tax=Roseomonas acroporae TaxID=2937791 RepID=A0A9X2BYY9_9PROT|nr:4Fe-4S dicluster domain-containing protein [Roseomonas acroporae]MCK8787499.1 4Fe-4S dicluster domain-containing protein [Roseomonas acroporae]
MTAGRPATDPTRRDALGLMAASTALALAGCDGPDEFGQPLWSRGRGAPDAASYATVLELDGLGRGVLVHTRAGHAVKVEGNPDHPASLGATDVFAEAAVLSLHDPERSRRVRAGGRPRPEAELEAALAAARETLRATGGQGLRLLTGPVSSPTLRRLIGQVLAAFPGAAWHRHAPLAEDAALDGALAAFGRPVAVVPDLARARAVLCLGADPLGAGPAQIRLARDWSEGRAAGRAAGALPWLCVAGATPGLTAARADRRLALPPAEVTRLARAVATALSVPGLAATAAHPEAGAIAARLRAAGPDALVLAGPGAGPEAHALAHATNAALGSAARRLVPSPLGGEGLDSERLGSERLGGEGKAGESLRDLVSSMAAGTVSHLLVLDADPVGEAPAALGFAAALDRVPFSLHLGPRLDATALAATWHAPLRHPLESWGDSLAFDGTPALCQPATVPLVASARDAAQVLLALLGHSEPEGGPKAGTARAAVRATWAGRWNLPADSAEFAARWEAALERGVAGEAPPALEPTPRPGWDTLRDPPPTDGLVAAFVPDPAVRAGEWAHNAWLRELPQPLTGLAWGNAALLAPATAAALGLRAGDEVMLALEDRRVPAPVLPLPGHAEGVVTLPLGGGRRVGEVAAAGRGFDAGLLRPADGAALAAGLTLHPTGRRAAPPLAPTARGQEEAPRLLAPGGSLAPPPRDASLLPDWPYPGPAWAMAIDLDACIGCNACVLACQAENNVPVVGPAAVAAGRAMHWLRIDRDVLGPAGGPEAAGRDPPATQFRPVPCMHCEQAPCEPACPVNATVHDSEGLNVMVHARCIGTRTCANACPYGVRRFNWEDHRRAVAGALRNPEVSLRPRGVMEKCTYCSHRIAAARAGAAAGDGPAGPARTACQSACPTRAIVFGDLADPDGPVARARRDGRHFLPLGQLGTRPRTSYLARMEGTAPAPPADGAPG